MIKKIFILFFKALKLHLRYTAIYLFFYWGVQTFENDSPPPPTCYIFIYRCKIYAIYALYMLSSSNVWIKKRQQLILHLKSFLHLSMVGVALPPVEKRIQIWACKTCSFVVCVGFYVVIHSKRFTCAFK